MQRIGIFLRVARVLIISEIEVGDRIELPENEINSKKRSLNVEKIFEILISLFFDFSVFYYLFFDRMSDLEILAFGEISQDLQQRYKNSLEYSRILYRYTLLKRKNDILHALYEIVNA